MKNNKFFWDTYASDFDAIYGTKNTIINSLINKFFRQAIKMRFEKTLRNIPDSKVSVIDIGCGPGHYCFALARSEKRNILGVDFSKKMIQIAKEHASDLNLSDRLDFKVVDFFKYDPLVKYDYSIMMGFIEYFENPEIVLRKVVSLTNRKIFISFPVAGGLLGFQRELRYRKKCYLRLYKLNDIKKLMSESDIQSYTIEKISRDFFVTVNVE
jgi:2-polyprenyl-3-methyl-5-hydroxy-6-metoxy-1,4-benzoquinol methylase